jgi:hypothetical protein
LHPGTLVGCAATVQLKQLRMHSLQGRSSGGGGGGGGSQQEGGTLGAALRARAMGHEACGFKGAVGIPALLGQRILYDMVIPLEPAL